MSTPYYFKTSDGRTTKVNAGSSAEAAATAQKIAKSNGVTVSSNLYGSNDELNAASAKPVTVLSSDQGKASIQPMIQQQQQDESGLATVTAANKAAKVEAAKSASTAKPPEVSYTADELNAVGADMNNYTYDPNSHVFVPKPDTVDDASGLKEINQSYDNDLEEIDNTFKSQQDSYDDAQSAVYDSITGIYKQLADETKDANARQYASYQNMGIREGGDRYARAINQGLLNSEERAGLGRLTDIAVKQAQALADAKSAAATKSWEIFAAKRSELDALKTQRQKEIDALRTSATTRLEEARKAKVQGQRDQLIVSALEADPTADAKTLFKTLIAQDPTITLKDVTDSMTAIAPGGDISKLSGDLRDFYILKQNGTLPSNISALPEGQQLTSYLTFMKNLGKTGTGGATTISSGGAKIAKSDLSLGAQALDTARGEDGYTDPNLYHNMYTQWIANGGLAQDFTKYYPPKQYINPENKDLPIYLQNRIGSSGQDDVVSAIQQLGNVLNTNQDGE